ncbi:MAG TPA: alpha/beta hydrolase [Chloroflexia bacterium]|nr:alpha/beta hydrolase [Chloroflexia bacterium]
MKILQNARAYDERRAQPEFQQASLTTDLPELESARHYVSGYWIYSRLCRANATPASLPVVLVHGLGVSSRYMIPAARYLAKAYSVYAPDLPGFGKSSRPAHTLDIAELAVTLKEWLDTVGLEKVILYANSMGCQVVTEFALRYPHRVDRLIMSGPTVDPAARSYIQQALRIVSDFIYEPPSLFFICLYDYLTAGPLRTLLTGRAALHDHIEDRLPLIKLPTLIVRGEHDTIAPEKWIEKATSLLPDSGLVRIPEVGHAINYNSPQALAEIIELFTATRGS